MSQQHESPSKAYHDRKFVTIASQLARAFPSLDIRFNRTSQNQSMRCVLPDVTDAILELDLNGETHALIIQATFEIKALAKLYDA